MSELAAFLKSRRARIQPQDVGIIDPSGTRRVQGLRREELASLAGVSVDYYIRLEQGRTRNVSDQILESVARVLALTPAETLHLKTLARPGTGDPQHPQRTVRPALKRILDAHVGTPAFITGRCTDVLAWNDLAEAIFGFSKVGTNHPNVARFVFTHPDAERFYLDWHDVAAEFVAWLHTEAARRPNDPELATLIGQLAVSNPAFYRLWARQDVHDRTHGVKRLRHPSAGELRLLYEVLTVPNEPDLLLTVFLPDHDDGETADRLRMLAATRPAAIGSA